MQAQWSRFGMLKRPELTEGRPIDLNAYKLAVP